MQNIERVKDSKLKRLIKN